MRQQKRVSPYRALFQGVIPGLLPEKTLPGWIFLFQNKRVSFCIPLAFLETILHLLYLEDSVKNTSLGSHPLYCWDLFLDSGKMLHDRPRQEKVKCVGEVLNIHSAHQRCCGVGDLNCSPNLGPADGKMHKLQFVLWQHHHIYAYIISKSVTKQV